MNVPQGFQLAGVTAGVKRSGRPDLGVIYSPAPLAWAYSATQNAAAAPCVARDRSLAAAGGPVRAVIVNSGNANCANGAQGVSDDVAFAAAAANALGLAGPEEVVSASTGVIGHKMPLQALVAAMPRLAAERSADADGFSKAILTTDLAPKVATASMASGARVLGVAKGSGMIHPNMATMFAFVMTDAQVDQETLRPMWQRVVERTFNQLTVDGDTSTNDMAVALSSNLVPTDADEVELVLGNVATELAKQIARDGEGATKLITVRVTGARTDVEARRAARTVAGSSLVKTAVHGADPNWGRILAAAGRSDVAMDMARAVVIAQGTELYRGQPLEYDARAVSNALRTADVLLEVDLGVGTAEGTAWGCDLTEGYVRINADYTT
ncbi:MAG: bifunctional glutamate N-acetyltransferase/amino-acid acetyltransferase ArgJ [Trueperaceae bacterium]|nr:bifunctional glutamate N-acetyltransferase/amino-acid acetyltransferase ArgJ [Trueperaceae bacterium]